MDSLTKYPFLKPVFWSYRLEDLSISKHQNLIIKQILNHGDVTATNWLKATYSSEQIKAVITASAASEWSKKSLALWSLLYDTKPNRLSRFA